MVSAQFVTFFIFCSGVRLYFSTSQFKHPTARPSMLTLVHVRLPPGFSASSNVEKPAKVHRALYSKGKQWNMAQMGLFFVCNSHYYTDLHKHQFYLLDDKWC